MFCRQCGTANAEDAKFCGACGASTAMPGRAAVNVVNVVNAVKKEIAAGVSSVSGTGATTDVLPAKPASVPPSPAKVVVVKKPVPEGVKGWSWGAFLLNWIWAIGNRTWWGLLALIPYVNVVVGIWLGMKGRELAWQNKEWEDLDHFNRVQRKWSQWGVGLVLVVVAVGILAAVGIPAYQDYRLRASMAEAMARVDAHDVAPVAQAPVSATPPAQAPAPAVVAAENGNASTGDLTPSAESSRELETKAGKLVVGQIPTGESVLMLNGVPLFKGYDASWQRPIRRFRLSGEREAILIASSGGRGTSCETLYFFLLVSSSGVTHTPLFGSCYPEGNYSQSGDNITISIPKMGGRSSFVLEGNSVTADGKVVQMTQDSDPAN